MQLVAISVSIVFRSVIPRVLSLRKFLFMQDHKRIWTIGEVYVVRAMKPKLPAHIIAAGILKHGR